MPIGDRNPCHAMSPTRARAMHNTEVKVVSLSRGDIKEPLKIALETAHRGRRFIIMIIFVVV